MVSKEILKKLKKIEIKSNKLSEELFSGEYHSFFKGNGMEFSEIRRYSQGDDIRSIDWKTSARLRKTYVKQFKEERELNIFVLVDVSSSNYYSDKKDFIMELVGSIAFSAVTNGDKVGSLFFSDEIVDFFPPKKGKRHALAMLERLITTKSENKSTNIGNALEHFSKIQKRRAIVFIVSDFYDENYEKTLKQLYRKHDVVLLKINDKRFEKLPKGAIFKFRDMETGKEVAIQNLRKEIDLRNKLNFKNCLELDIGEDYVKPLLLFFKKRMK